MEYGLIGLPLGHSFSAPIHEALGGYRYELHELQPQELEPFLRRRAFRAINVTIPYKTAVLPLLDVVDKTAAAIGAVNTVVNRGGKLYGYNTDYFGMRCLLYHLGAQISGEKCLILGTGGTSRTAATLLRDMGAKTVLRVSRTAKEGALEYASLGAHGDASVLINTTPCGMFPQEEKTPLSLADAGLCRLKVVADAVYNPLRTRLVQNAQTQGAAAAGGLRMLVFQAAAAAELFLGETIDSAKAEAVYKAILLQKRNTVLIGMPGSGKTTLGRMLARQTGRVFLDTDALFLSEYGVKPDVFLWQRGEEAFRAAESAVINARARRAEGAVIATGGGVVTRKENIEMLRERGLLVFLDRPLCEIRPTEDRPLSSDRAALEARYAEREPLYRAAADKMLQTGGKTAKENAGALAALVAAAE